MCYSMCITQAAAEALQASESDASQQQQQQQQQQQPQQQQPLAAAALSVAHNALAQASSSTSGTIIGPQRVVSICCCCTGYNKFYKVAHVWCVTHRVLTPAQRKLLLCNTAYSEVTYVVVMCRVLWERGS
jgi:glucose/arabinose dehydrogenase